MTIPYTSSTNIPWEIKQKLANYRLFIFSSVDSELVSANMSWNRWQSLEISKDGSFSSVQELLKGNLSSIWQYLYLENGSIDRPEIFIGYFFRIHTIPINNDRKEKSSIGVDILSIVHTHIKMTLEYRCVYVTKKDSII
jgi:hypothetical protein